MSIDPTSYDLQQDSRIDALNEIITTSYEEPSQIEYSYPVVGQGMNDEQWQYVALALGSGVMDEGGRPYWLKLNGSEANTNSTNTMLLTVSTTTDTAQAAVRGFYHRLLADKVVDLPAVTSETTYYVVLQYDPLGHDRPTGPITVEVVTRLESTQGKFNIVLWTVKRKPNQLLTDAEILQVRPKLSPTMTVDSDEQRRAISLSGLLWGTLCVVMRTGEIWRAGGQGDASGGPNTWVSVSSPEWVERGDTSGYRWPGFGYKRAQRRVGKTVELRGTIERTGDGYFSPGNSYLVMNLSGDNIPEKNSYFLVAGSSGSNPKHGRLVVFGKEAAGKVETPPGDVRVFPKEDATWFAIDGVRFDVE